MRIDSGYESKKGALQTRRAVEGLVPIAVWRVGSPLAELAPREGRSADCSKWGLEPSLLASSSLD